MPLWTRGLLSDPSWKYPQPTMTEFVVWEKKPVGNILEGECYGDGSGRRPRFARLRRCGWGIVCYTRGVGFSAVAHGPLPGWQQEVPLAENFAFMFALRHADVRVAFFTDCLFVKDTYEKGPEHSSSGWFVYARVWREIWKLALDIGMDNIEVTWIPTHTSAKAVAEGRITGLQRICNAKADGQAKLGADLHKEDLVIAQRTQEAVEVVRRVGHYIGTINAIVGHRTARDTTATKTDRELGQQSARAARTSFSKHVPTVVGKRFRCRVCMRSASTLTGLSGLPCRQAGQTAPHSLRVLSDVVFCAVCGAFSSRKTRGLLHSCPRSATGSRATALRRLLAGLHPKTGARIGSMASMRLERDTPPQPATRLPGRPSHHARPLADDRDRFAECAEDDACQCAQCQVLHLLGRIEIDVTEGQSEDPSF